ncbi:MAG: hypothetical protein IKP28_05095 [Clostridia bacterium]|nr:hypothetical protein [Clostridia bacterium]
MYFYNLIKEMASKNDLILFIDMDGVIASYDIGKNPFDFLHKRPLTQNIANIKEVSELENVEVCILSVCREDSQIEDKNVWLDANAPFFKKENRNIISRASQDWKSAKDIKTDFLKDVKTDKQIVLVDDDNEVLKHIHQNYGNIIVLQDSELVD